MLLLYLQQMAKPKIYKTYSNVYTKGGLLCVEFVESAQRKVHKYPLCNVFRVEEEY